MPSDITPMHQYLAKLGLEPELADVYLALHAYGPQSLFQLARNSKVERTRLYRLIDTLTACHLLEIETHYKRKIYKAAPINNLQILLTRKEQELRDLHTELRHLQHNLQQTSLRSPLTHVQFYRGSEGVKQMFWNETRATTDNLSILYENMQSRTNLAFFERWAMRCNDRRLQFRSIVCEHFLSSQKAWYDRHTNEKLQFWEGRLIPNEIFAITHSMATYDDVIAYYNWKDGEIFGIEIYNQEMADTQRQLFEMLWQQATPLGGN